ncbi:MAG: PilN domain-containing protein [Desulfuromonas sp.]|nr:PilN domain-containing protein [Desulfuromonas sp.]
MQQINLYQEQFKQQRQFSLLMWTCYALLLVLLVLALVSWMQRREERNLQQLVTRSQAQNQQLLDAVGALEQQMSALKPNPRLQQQLQQLRSQLRQRQPLRVALDQLLAQKNTIPLGLTALAARPLHKLWLEKIELLDGGSLVRLQGLAVKPDTVPQFIEQLAQQQVFAQQAFAQLQLEQQSDGLYKFELSTTMEDGQ